MSSEASVATSESKAKAIARGSDYMGLLVKRYAVRSLLYVVLVGLAVVAIMPLTWMLSSSLKPEDEVYVFPPELIPRTWDFSHYLFAIGIGYTTGIGSGGNVSSFPFWISLSNTLIIVIGVMAGNVLTCSLTAYVLARLHFPLRNALFTIILATMMVPYHVYLIPQYILFRNLGWLNSPKPLIIPSLFGLSGFFIFMLRQFFMSIPQEYDEAARIDGCGRLAIFWRIIMPLSLPALGTVAIFTFIGTWNDFLGPLIYLNEPKKQTLAIAIHVYEQLRYHVGVYWTDLLATAVVITLPPMLLFFVAQRYFIQGIVVSGMKG